MVHILVAIIVKQILGITATVSDPANHSLNQSGHHKCTEDNEKVTERQSLTKVGLRRLVSDGKHRDHYASILAARLDRYGYGVRPTPLGHHCQCPTHAYVDHNEKEEGHYKVERYRLEDEPILVDDNGQQTQAHNLLNWWDDEAERLQMGV